MANEDPAAARSIGAPHPEGSGHFVAEQKRLVDANPYRNTWDYRLPVPDFDQARDRYLPEPQWPARPDVVECYWDTWALAWRNLRLPYLENGFLAPYLGTAFNGAVFMWDSAFICQFADYGRQAMPFIRTLDVLYCKQEEDGFICREISENTGKGRWIPHQARSTGPNVLAWAEWCHFQRSADLERTGPGVLGRRRLLVRWGVVPHQLHGPEGAPSSGTS